MSADEEDDVIRERMSWSGFDWMYLDSKLPHHNNQIQLDIAATRREYANEPYKHIPKRSSCPHLSSLDDDDKRIGYDNLDGKYIKGNKKEKSFYLGWISDLKKWYKKQLKKKIK